MAAELRRTAPVKAARAASEALLKRAAQQVDAELAWRYLQAAHIAGQGLFMPHLRIHLRMLCLALHERDGREVAGQLFRLVLVPLGHATQRLPWGNPGRATVSAFTPLPVEPALQTLIDSALQAIPSSPTPTP